LVYLLAPMGEVGKNQRVMHFPLASLLYPDEGHPTGLGAWVKFEGHILYPALHSAPVLESDDEGHAPVNHRSLVGEQEACPFLRAGHEWLVVLINDKDAHDLCSFLPPEGGPLTGLVTLLFRREKQTPLANGGTACSAGRTDPYSEGSFNDQQQSHTLRWHAWVP
jgi:hypothetical protein